MIKGMDVSSLPEVEACGGRFYDRGQQGELLTILRSYGMNFLRLRLWNDPYTEDGRPYGAGTNDLGRTMELARRAKRLGMDWLLDFHYSDFWADPGKQTLPKAWRGLNRQELEEAVYDFTASTLRTLRAEGIAPAMVAVGNELSNGLLWPLGKVPNFDAIVPLLNAGIRAVREVLPEAEVMLHLDNGGNRELYRYWFDSYFANGGADFDVIGLSYYPFWHGTMEELRANMQELAEKWHKDMLVVETSMGHTLEDYADYERCQERKGMAADAVLAQKVPYPMTPEGQSAFMADLMKLIAGIPGGRGFVYWEPAWLPVHGSGWAREEALAYIGEKGPGGNEWANQALFDYAGNALPALKTIRDFGEAT